MHPPAQSSAQPSPTLVGWREWVSLPGSGVDWLKAKIDTGARTSALHAFDVQQFRRDDAPWVRFQVHPWQTSAKDAKIVELPVKDTRVIRSSNGSAQPRLVVAMPLSLAGRQIEAEVTLTDRDEMGFRMLIGREALGQGFLVDPAASYLGGLAPKAVRRRNWGKR
ncbi:MAG: ATP-dependent zinc protease [Micrococcus sp.]|nr:ATP-dependent zinc protease [Micrococcus sp.]